MNEPPPAPPPGVDRDGVGGFTLFPGVGAAGGRATPLTVGTCALVGGAPKDLACGDAPNEPACGGALPEPAEGKGYSGGASMGVPAVD